MNYYIYTQIILQLKHHTTKRKKKGFLSTPRYSATVRLQIIRAGKSGLLGLGRMVSKLFHSCLYLLAWEETGWAGNRTAVIQKRVKKKRKEVRASGDGDKKQ